MTKEIVETYQICNPQFKYSEDLNPKRFLTTPSTGVLNDGYDNANSDLILTVNLVLIHVEKNRRFIIHILFHGSMLSLYMSFVNTKSNTCRCSVDIKRCHLTLVATSLCLYKSHSDMVQIYRQRSPWPWDIWTSGQMLGCRDQ